MKPTQQQKQWLQEYLQGVLKYRETCIEVYDHVLTALEEKPAAPFFETNVVEIIESDFGGSNGLLKLEENFETGFSQQIKSDYNSLFTRKWLGVPAFAYFVLLSFCFSQLIKIYHYHNISIGRLRWCTMLLCWFVPLAMYFLGSIKTGGLFQQHLFSAKRNVLRKIVFRPVKFFLLYIFYSGACFYIIMRFFRHSSLNLNYVAAYLMQFFSVFIFVLSIMHVFAFYKVYSREFKMNLSLNNLSKK